MNISLPGSAESTPGNAEHQLGFKKMKNEEANAELVLGVPRHGIPMLGWYSRGYIPHYDTFQKLQTITFRLADSLPQNKLRQLEEELEFYPASARDTERRKKIEEWLDAGMGSCALRHPEVAGTMQETLLRFDGSRYRLIAWCIMPNHVHVLIEPRENIGRIVQSWKSYTGRWVMAKNTELGLGIPGKSLWMREYWDRFIRDERHYISAVNYINENPVKAGLCDEPQGWLWSSAGFKPGNAESTPGSAEHQLGF